MNNLETVVNRANGFNEISAWLTPNGELIISLSHRTTNDEDVLIRVCMEEDVILCDEVDSADWEDESTMVGRLNHGGNWS